MRTEVPDKVLKFANLIATEGQAKITRLTVLKKWFQRSSRLEAFAIWAASRAVAQPGKVGGVAAQLFKVARRLLRGHDKLHPEIDRDEAQRLYDALRAFQNKYERRRWADVRIITNWDLLVVEEAVRVYLWNSNAPAAGYALAATYFRPYEWRGSDKFKRLYVAKLKELARFMVWVEKREDEEL